MRINLILTSNFFPGKNAEPFLESEYPFLNNNFKNITMHRFENVLSPSKNEKINLLELKHPNLRVRNVVTQNISLLIGAFWKEMVISGSPVFYIKNLKRFFNLWIGWLQQADAWEQALKQFDPNETIIYTYWYENQAMPLSILRAQGKLPFKWVSRAHGWDVDKRQRREGIIPFRHWMLKYKPDRLVSISEFGKDIFKKDYNAQVEVSKLGTADLGLSQANEKADLIEIVSISSLIPLKRVELIIEVLCKTNAKIKWIHYGDGPLNDSLKWDKLPDNITLVKKGHTDHQTLLAELKASHTDLMVHFSELEGIPVSIMECMSMGIPVMACDTGGVAEIVDESCGWLLPVNFKVEKVAVLIDSIANNKILASEKRPLARKKWEKEYQADVNFPHFIDTVLLKN